MRSVILVPLPCACAREYLVEIFTQLRREVPPLIPQEIFSRSKMFFSSRKKSIIREPLETRLESHCFFFL